MRALARRAGLIRLLLALLMLVQALLRWHWVSTLLRGLEVTLVLQRLLIRHVRLRNVVIGHAALWKGLWDLRGVRLFRRLDIGLAVHAVGVGGFGGVQASLSSGLVDVMRA